MLTIAHRVPGLFIAGLALLLPQQLMAGTISGTVEASGLRSAEEIMVYLDKLEAPGGRDTYVMDQYNLTFVPHILPVPVGSTVKFPNNDEVDHNVFSLSRTQKFNLGSYKPGESKSITFDEPGIVELRCDVHAEMIAYIMVLKNPYATLTGSDGSFSLPKSGGKEIPPGDYRLKVWHEKLRPVSKKVTVPEEGEVVVDLRTKRGPAGSVLYK